MSTSQTRSGAVFSPFPSPHARTYCAETDLGMLLRDAYASEEPDEEELGCESEDDADLSVHERLEASPGSLDVSVPIGDGPSNKDGVSDKVRRRRERQRVQRLKRRLLEQGESGFKTKAIARLRMSQAKPLCLDHDVNSSRRASTGMLGLLPLVSRKNQRVLALEKEGFKVIPWDDPSNSFAFVDSAGRMFVGGGCPKDPGWRDVNIEACRAINQSRNECSFRPEQRVHQRGAFPVLASGVSFGGGRQRPLNVKNSVRNAASLKKLLENSAIKRIAGFQNKFLHSFAPRLGEFYASSFEALLASQPELIRNFPFSDFASITVNFGPITETIDHVDSANLAAGLCAVTALGDFDPKAGGHLILWDLRLILEFPPGATILLPSALLRHSNTPINEGSCRFSVTQYSAGGLFRWVHNGFRRNKDCTPETLTTAAGQQRWEEGLARFEVASDFVRA